MVDIDHFKEVNDRWGHDAGDAVLQQMRARLESVFRESDHLVRWGGEEFLIVVRATSRQRACELAERARRAVGDHEFRLPGGQTVRRSCSIGFACLPLSRSHPQAMGWDAVQSLADAALMQAKAEGRDPWIGVLDAGNLSEPELNSAVSAAYRLRSGGLTVQRGGASTNELS